MDRDGDETKIAVSVGDNLLDVAQAHDIEMEGQLSMPLAEHQLISE